MIDKEYVNNSVLLENDKTRYFFVIGQSNSVGSSISQDRGSSGPSVCAAGLQNLGGTCYGSCPSGNYVSGINCIETKARNSAAPVCSGDFILDTTNNQLCKKTTARPNSNPTLCSSDQEKIGNLCYFSCNDGYNLDSSNRTQCISSSKSWTNPILEISLTNMKNQINITYYQDQSTPLTIQIDNVPIYQPFRIGLTVSPYAIEGYLNGLLRKTLTSSSGKTFLAANEFSKIFATYNIVKNTGPSSAETLSSGIKVLNVRAFGYIVSPAEMKARMKDLKKKSQYRNAGSLV
jgi:hypothetical protein